MGNLRVIVSAVAALISLVSVLAPAGAQTSKRVALVIGNSAYQNVGPLANPVNDAEAIATLLKQAGFDVVEHRSNLTIANLRRAVSNFSDTAADTDIALVFFAGHGIEVDGTNYLIPIDATLARDFDVDDEAISLDRVLKAIEPARRLRLVILDACRDNPFVRTMRRSTRAIGRGLARVDPTTADTLVAFAAKAGSTAADGQGSNSSFTAALLNHLTTPNLDIRLALGRVRDEVMTTTRPRQEPFVYGSLGGRTITIIDGLEVPPPPQTTGSDEFFWQAIKGSTVSTVFEEFLKKFPGSPRAAEARKRLDELRRTAALSPERERALKPNDSFQECHGCPEMVVVPAGHFMMGSPTDEQGRLYGRTSLEDPRHQVKITRPFAVGRYAVTFDEWDTCVADGACNGYTPQDEGWGRGQHPVINVNWHDAKAYVDWLSRKTGKAYRLLTESEREYVTRADTTSPFWWGKSVSMDHANYDGTQPFAGEPAGAGRQRTIPVNSFAPNPFGLYQMHGNVWEWVEDCWNPTYKGAPSDGSAWTTGNCNLRIQRGGSWAHAPRYMRSARRNTVEADWRGNIQGFRVARTLDSGARSP
jgi:formylglycine-generating enzyme required for sulfatase activity